MGIALSTPPIPPPKEIFNKDLNFGEQDHERAKGTTASGSSSTSGTGVVAQMAPFSCYSSSYALLYPPVHVHDSFELWCAGDVFLKQFERAAHEQGINFELKALTNSNNNNNNNEELYSTHAPHLLWSNDSHGHYSKSAIVDSAIVQVATGDQTILFVTGTYKLCNCDTL